MAPDFYSYFQSLRKLLDFDPSVWCVSAWNDNGKDGYIDTSANGAVGRLDTLTPPLMVRCGTKYIDTTANCAGAGLDTMTPPLMVRVRD